MEFFHGIPKNSGTLTFKTGTLSWKDKNGVRISKDVNVVHDLKKWFGFYIGGWFVGAMVLKREK